MRWPCFSYGDGLTNVNLSVQLEFHRKQGKLATLLAVQPPARYGWVEMDGAKINKFSEKPRGDGGLINGGFFILSPKVLNYIVDDTTSWERDCLNTLATDNQLVGYEHRGFWKAMDTLRDKNYLESEGKMALHHDMMIYIACLIGCSLQKVCE